VIKLDEKGTKKQMDRLYSKIREMGRPSTSHAKKEEIPLGSIEEIRSYVEVNYRYAKSNNFSRKDLKSSLDAITEHIKGGDHLIFEQNRGEIDDHVNKVVATYGAYKVAKHSRGEDASTPKTAYDDASREYLQFLQKQIDSVYQQTNEELFSLTNISNSLIKEIGDKSRLNDFPRLRQLDDYLNNLTKITNKFQERAKTGKLHMKDQNMLREAMEDQKILRLDINDAERGVDTCREQYRIEELEKLEDMNWVDNEGWLAVGGSIQNIGALRLGKITFVVDMRHPTELQGEPDHEKALRDQGIELLKLPVISRGVRVPKVGQVEEAVRWVINHLTEGKCGLIHCDDGRSRSVALASCVLLEKEPEKWEPKGASSSQVMDKARARALSVMGHIMQERHMPNQMPWHMQMVFDFVRR